MGGLPRPDVPPGPRRDLVDALHDLHHHAGWPSLRTLAREAGCSHTTVSAAFSSPRLPSWGTLELLVEAMDGDTATFHDLWLAASAPEEGPPPTTARIAGRREELAAVRRHLETGSGLLLVTGEAGIGKTRLVSTAATTADAFVATGSCLPLSTEVPLLPVSDVLQAVHAVDGGQWVKDALAGAAPYVAGSLHHLLPELGSEAPAPDPADEWARHRLFSAVAAILAGLADLRPFAILVEDLHWSDTTTLDLLEHLVARGPGVRVVGTWRVDDQTVAPENLEWFPRIRRLPAVTTLPLTPLSRDDTREQLALLTGQVPATGLVASIHRRTQGHPLFTEQLAAHAGTDRPFPSLLADLLDARLGELTGSAWSVSRALGVAGRPLPSKLLATITGLTEADLAVVLHDLDARRLLAPSRGQEVALRHPLLAEAIRRRLVAGEAGGEHAAVARALASLPDAEPAEIAVHWQAAGDREEELAWRIRAARMARERFALRHEAEQWARALELWPDGTVEAGDPPVRRNQALASVMDLVGGIGRDRAAMLAADSLTLVPELPGHEGAELLHHVGFYFAEVGDTELGLELLERAIAIYDRAPPSEGHVRALYGMELALRGTGRHQEAAAAVARGVEVSAELGDRRWFRHMLMEQAWYDARAGDVDTALARAREASEVAITGPDPRGEARLAAEYTDLLLLVAGDVGGRGRRREPRTCCRRRVRPGHLHGPGHPHQHGPGHVAGGAGTPRRSVRGALHRRAPGRGQLGAPPGTGTARHAPGPRRGSGGGRRRAAHHAGELAQRAHRARGVPRQRRAVDRAAGGGVRAGGPTRRGGRVDGGVRRPGTDPDPGGTRRGRVPDATWLARPPHRLARVVPGGSLREPAGPGRQQSLGRDVDGGAVEAEGPAERRPVAHGCFRVGPAAPSARRGVLPVAGGAGRPGRGRAGARHEAAPPGRPGRPRARPAQRSHREHLVSALPRPDLPPGPHRDLNDALHDLHHRAGWPSLRTLAREAGCSHTTVSAVFSSARLPSWGTLELVVEALDGDTAHFRDLWLAASDPDRDGPVGLPALAGRRAELAAVRRHLETGTGLLLVTGEAGIGKTRLVQAAADATDAPVTVGHCLPLSTEVPLMPIVDIVAAVHDIDDGQWLEEALTRSPSYVRGSLSRLLPALNDGATVGVAADEFARQHLFTAVARFLSQLHELRAVGLVLEDLHWADPATLDLLEHVVARATRLPLVGTWRLDDLTVPAAHTDWLVRMQRLPGTTVVDLSPLTLEETSEQLRLLAGAQVGADRVRRIHDRSRGHPLFTERLATAEDDQPLPPLLADILDRSLDGLGQAATAIATVLGVADRGLPDSVLKETTGLEQGKLVSALHELDDRHLLAVEGAGRVALRHPLLGRSRTTSAASRRVGRRAPQAGRRPALPAGHRRRRGRGALGGTPASPRTSFGGAWSPPVRRTCARRRGQSPPTCCVRSRSRGPSRPLRTASTRSPPASRPSTRWSSPAGWARQTASSGRPWPMSRTSTT